MSSLAAVAISSVCTTKQEVGIIISFLMKVHEYMVSQVAGRKQGLRFKDTEEGDVELAETEGNEDKQDTNDKEEQEGEKGSGEESDKAADQEQTNKDTVTLTTFGHTPDDANNTEEKEEAAKLDEVMVIVSR